MAKRKLPIYFNDEVFAEGNEEAGSDEDAIHVLRPNDEKRRRRVSDVIDSTGDHSRFFPDGFTTPRRGSMYSDLMSPESDASATPELVTPDSVQFFMPDWVQRSPDVSDAGRMGSNMFVTKSHQESASDETKTVASMPTAIDSDRYNMNHTRRGKCIIFNHEYFDTGFDRREGSSVDAKRIEQTFQNLDFEVEVLDDLNHADIVETINKLKTDDHEDVDCLCVFVLTHGLSNELISAKDVVYKTDTIWKPFTADKCPSLAGKPKLFFFQACRGDELDSGVTLARVARMRTQTDSMTCSYSIPTHADFLLAYSSVQGFFSWRNPTSGTWFVQCLCKVLDEYAETTDLIKMLTITARKIATERESFNDLNPDKHEKKQVPSITSMLIRDIYFTPK